jgi:hypothetical protein
MKRIAILIAFALSCTGCPENWPPVKDDPSPTSTVPPNPAPDPVLDAGVDPDVAACDRYKELACKSRDGRNLWEDTPGGVSCPDVFRNAKKNDIDLHPACIAKMAKCEDRHACTAKE